MEPGRELDALVAERVIGWRNLEWCEACHEGGTIAPEGWYGDGPGGECYLTREYSVDIAAAWQVVEKMIDIGYSVFVDYVERWRCFITQGGGESPVEATSAPLAICLAALEAIGVEVEDGTG